MALNYADIGMRVLPSYAGDVLADQIRPDRPGAKTPGVDTPLPGKGEAGSFTQFATTLSQETEVDLTVDYSTSDDSGGPAGTAYPVKGATPFELNITAINTAQIDPAAYSPASPSSFKEWLTSKVDERLGTNYTFNPITGGYRPTGPGGAIGLALPGPLGAFAQVGAAASQRSLENIAGKAYAGEEGYAVAYVNGRVVGVGPSPFGGYTLTGQLPANLSPQQRQSIVKQLLNIPSESAAGAYRPEGMTAAESIAGAGKPSDGDTTPLPADTPAPDYSYTSYEPSDDSGPSGNQYSISDPVDTAPAQDYSYTSYEPSGGGGSSSSGGSSFSDTGGFGAAGFRAKGGRIDMADGGSADPVQGNGFVEGSPDNYSDSQTVADDEYRRVRPGSFVMNAPMTEKLQEAGVLPRGVDNPAKKSTIKANKGGMIDVALSKGEYVFEPEEAEEIGYDVLNKINDMGKPEVDRRQAAADGGFINGYQEGGITLPVPSPVRQRAAQEEDIPLPDIPDSFRQKLVAFMQPIVDADKKPNRTQINNFLKSLDSKEQLAFLFLTETVSNSAPMVEMENLGEVVFNRVDSDYRDFSKLTNQEQVLLQHVDNNPKKSKQFTGLEPSTVFARAKEVVGGLAEPGLRKAYAASENVHSDDPDRASLRRLPYATVFYTKKDAPNQWMRESKDLEYAGEEGGHEYYRPISISVEGAQEAAQKYRYTNINPEFP